MARCLSVLQVHESGIDADRILQSLQKAGHVIEFLRVWDAHTMQTALHSQAWDAVVSAYQLVHFDAAAALRILQDSGQDIPFVVVAGNIGEAAAVALIRSGVHDFVSDNELERLAPVIDREICVARLRRESGQPGRQLSEPPQRLAQVIEAARLGIFDFFLGTQRFACSERTALHFGLPGQRDNAYGAVLQSVHADDRHRFHDVMQSLQKRESANHFFLEYRTVDVENGTQRSIAAWGGLSCDNDGAPRVTGVTLDVSERAQIEDQLRQFQKLESVGRLAGGVAHDFNNLLTVINGYSDMLMAKLPPGGSLRDLAGEIRTAGERAAALTGQLLLFSRKQVVRPHALNLNQIIDELREMLARLLGDDIRLQCELSPDLGQILADSGQLCQVLMNLSVNAREAMPEGGILRIETRNIDIGEHFAEQHVGVKPGPYVQLSVSDTGSGMTKEAVAHLFEPFFTTKEAGCAAGLGLATVYGIVKQCEGSIWVDTEPKRGTTFTMYFPLGARHEPVLCAPELAKLSLRGTETILVVEDLTQLRKMAVGILTDHGYDVREAGSAEEALRHAGQYAGPIHLLLTDVVMPGMSGYELSVRLTASRPSMKTILMSGYSELMLDRQKRPANGAYLAKPFSPQGLALKVRETLGSACPVGQPSE